MKFWWFSSSSEFLLKKFVLSCAEFFQSFQGYENVPWNIFQIFLQHDAVMQVRNYF